MLKPLIKLLLCVISIFFLSGCLSDIWTGASLIYDRHNLYKNIHHYKLSMQVNNALHKDHLFKCRECHIEIAIFNDDILLLGNVPNQKLKHEAYKRVAKIRGPHRLFNQISVSPLTNDSLKDSFITTKIRSQIIANSKIDPHAFKIVTYEGNVYLMGNVMPEQADLVVDIARKTQGVRQVVKLFRYYKLSDQVT